MKKELYIEGITMRLSGEALPEDEGYVKDLLRANWQCQNVKTSKRFLQKWNAVQKQAQDKKINLVHYMACLLELQKLERNNFASFGVTTARTFIEKVEDKYGMTHNVQVTVDSGIERVEALTFLGAFRLLPFGGDEFSREVVTGFRLKEQRRVGPPTDYTNNEEFVQYLQAIDLKRFVPAFDEMIEAGKATFKKYEGKVGDDAAERARLNILESLDKILKDYHKKAADPSPYLIGEHVSDVRLALHLDALAEEAWTTAVKWEQEGKDSPLKKLKDLSSLLVESPEEKVHIVHSVEEAQRLSNGLGRPIQYKIVEE